MSSPSGRDARDAAAQRPLPSVVATAATAAIASSAAAAAYAVLALEWATIIFARYRPFRKGLTGKVRARNQNLHCFCTRI